MAKVGGEGRGRASGRRRGGISLKSLQPSIMVSPPWPTVGKDRMGCTLRPVWLHCALSLFNVHMGQSLLLQLQSALTLAEALTVGHGHGHGHGYDARRLRFPRVSPQDYHCCVCRGQSGHAATEMNSREAPDQPLGWTWQQRRDSKGQKTAAGVSGCYSMR